MKLSKPLRNFKEGYYLYIISINHLTQIGINKFKTSTLFINFFSIYS